MMTHSGLAWVIVHQSLFFLTSQQTSTPSTMISFGTSLVRALFCLLTGAIPAGAIGRGDRSIHRSLPFRMIWSSNVFLFFFNTCLKLLGEVICHYEVQNHHRDDAIAVQVTLTDQTFKVMTALNKET